MAKGHNCPNCGENTFHAEGRVRVCTSCKAEGWVDGEPGKPGAGRGKTCGHCGELGLRDMASVNGAIVKYCYCCYSVAVVA